MSVKHLRLLSEESLQGGYRVPYLYPCAAAAAAPDMFTGLIPVSPFTEQRTFTCEDFQKYVAEYQKTSITGNLKQAI